MAKEIDEEVKKDFRMLYQNWANNMEFIKTRQWKTTYYVMLLLSGLIWYKSNSGDCTLQVYFLNFLGLVIFGLGSYALILFLRELKDQRDIRRGIESELSDKMEKFSQNTEKESPHIDDKILLMMFSSMLGAFLLLLFFPLR